MKPKISAPEGMKLCSKCKEVKQNSEFYVSKKAKCGLYSWCKTCTTKTSARYYNSNLEKQRENQRAKYAKNREKYIAYNRTWRAANPEKNNAMHRKADRKSIETLSDKYIAQKLHAPISDLPQELIEAKRLQLTIKRELQNGNYRHHKPAK